jgi:hypothetical protein
MFSHFHHSLPISQPLFDLLNWSHTLKALEGENMSFTPIAHKRSKALRQKRRPSGRKLRMPWEVSILVRHPSYFACLRERGVTVTFRCAQARKQRSSRPKYASESRWVRSEASVWLPATTSRWSSGALPSAHTYITYFSCSSRFLSVDLSVCTAIWYAKQRTPFNSHT